ncbi:hypothetical protein BJ166DRAFT_284615 [Pestalotiopsis sp. NC0098]|nr:hypothetical protein BJ166DRAFT_284615 [Pestalotiopsis sp. NC0098]
MIIITTYILKSDDDKAARIRRETPPTRCGEMQAVVIGSRRMRQACSASCLSVWSTGLGTAHLCLACPCQVGGCDICYDHHEAPAGQLQGERQKWAHAVSFPRLLGPWLAWPFSNMDFVTSVNGWLFLFLLLFLGLGPLECLFSGSSFSSISILVLSSEINRRFLVPVHLQCERVVGLAEEERKKDVYQDPHP